MIVSKEKSDSYKEKSDSYKEKSDSSTSPAQHGRGVSDSDIILHMYTYITTTYKKETEQMYIVVVD